MAAMTATARAVPGPDAPDTAARPSAGTAAGAAPTKSAGAKVTALDAGPGARRSRAGRSGAPAAAGTTPGKSPAGATSAKSPAGATSAKSAAGATFAKSPAGAIPPKSPAGAIPPKSATGAEAARRSAAASGRTRRTRAAGRPPAAASSRPAAAGPMPGTSTGAATAAAPAKAARGGGLAAGRRQAPAVAPPKPAKSAVAALTARLGIGPRRSDRPPVAGATPARPVRAAAPGPSTPATSRRPRTEPPAAAPAPRSAMGALAARLGLGRRRHASPAPGATPARPAGEGSAAFAAAALGDPALAEALAGVDALAFAADPESESALAAGLSECREAQVWPGDLRTATAAVARGHAARLLFVDLDGTPYPAGAIHELAAVCEVGTVVIALGSDHTARFSREILLCGVSDYLVKPIAAPAVREAAARAAAASPSTLDGCVAAFTGAGGSGATTLAAATALAAAERGRYVSVLDLGRGFAALPFALDVEPASGLDQLLEAAGETAPDPEALDGVCAQRSDRIALYGYRPGAAPASAPPAPAVRGLLAALKRRSHLVLVDGLDDPETRLAVLAAADARVLVAEPTGAGAARAARLLGRLGPGGTRPILVQNHTRAFKPAAGARVLAAAGVVAPPDVVVPFEPAVPETMDRGWPQDRIPRGLRTPVAALADRLLAPAAPGEHAAPAALRTPAPAGAASAAPSGVSSRGRTAGPAAAPRPRFA